METQGEQLLQSLVDHEQELAAKVEAAKREARERIEGARQKADEIRAQAERTAQEKEQEMRSNTEREAGDAREAILAQARARVDEISSRSAAHRSEAVELVMERVLP